MSGRRHENRHGSIGSKRLQTRLSIPRETAGKPCWSDQFDGQLKKHQHERTSGMNRTLLLGIACILALVGVSLTGGEQRAVAGHRWHGCAGCYGGYVSYGCYGCWGTSYSAYRVCHGHARRGCYGCYGCSGYVAYGCHGCGGCYGCSGCYGCGGYVSYGCSGCYGCGGCGGTRVIESGTPQPATPQPATPDQPMPEAQPQGASPEASAPSPGSATLRVRVPSQTTILVNGKPTRSTGEQRSYVSHGLQPGQHYVYEVRAELVRRQNPGRDQGDSTA